MVQRIVSHGAKDKAITGGMQRLMRQRPSVLSVLVEQIHRVKQQLCEISGCAYTRFLTMLFAGCPRVAYCSYRPPRRPLDALLPVANAAHRTNGDRLGDTRSDAPTSLLFFLDSEILSVAGLVQVSELTVETDLVCPRHAATPVVITLLKRRSRRRRFKK